mmetsp:Transcript_54177/g.129019  ORF Transcript_54177/g.129019 Transcript_54177/m.129019 type:complete len:819 (-) Transcript_54177:175-2631(-)|eukprot:CAMPEP_0178383956 /NCGR_PEP_ID=MMETSP0689_2-20121128/7267_1 /TAXON_ID=160604 /ORGANISM="Amphidinium massartii, Strain CS-259" /LENGTH=818 /DNA_ID=CAMNT_0020004189 /DNA_START=182 /DNA_END=2638 /DNA_ORIENTATION=+
MGLPDEELLCPDAVSESLRCLLCRGLYVDPVFCWGGSCQHTFCRSCIEAELLRRRRCPVCREAIDRKDLQPNKGLQALVNEVIVRCGSDNCTWTGTYGTRPQHEQACHPNRSESKDTGNFTKSTAKHTKARLKAAKEELAQLNEALRSEVSELNEVFEGLLNERELLKQQLGPALAEAFSSRRHIFSLLQRDALRLVKLSFLAEYDFDRQGPMPRRQDLPAEAFLDVASMSVEEFEKIDVLALSYCWVSKAHPDPTGYHTKTLSALCRMYMKGNKAEIDFFTPCFRYRGEMMSRFQLETKCGITSFGADGKREKAAIFWDWASLHQELPEARRTPKEQTAFKDSLASIHVLYGATFSTKWVLATTPSEAAQYRKSAQDSGWMRFEMQVASFASKPTSVVEVSQSMRDRLLAQRNSFDAYDYMRFVLESFEAYQRPALMAPAQFAELVDQLRFTTASDRENIVKPCYSETFERLFAEAQELSFPGFCFSNKAGEVTSLLQLAQAWCKALKTLDLSGNVEMSIKTQEFSLLSSLSSLTTLCLRRCPQVDGDLGAFASLRGLEVLDLQATQVSGGLSSLAPLTKLTYLNLQSTEVDGDVSNLSGLTGLKRLDLQLTKVTGSLQGLKSLSSLQSIDLWSTQVSGDVGFLASMSTLWKLFLQSTKVSGDLSGLTALTSLIYLDLRNTEVCGDIRSLRHLKALRTLDLQATQVSGDVASLSPLTSLEHADLSQTQVSGDIASLSSLTALQSLDLWATRVSGEVGSLRPLSLLTFLDIQSTKVEGDLGSLITPVAVPGLYLPTKEVDMDKREMREVLPQCAVWFH